MIRSVFKLPHKIAGQMAVDILARNMSGQPRQRMEDYFKDKKFIVTGSCAGKLYRHCGFKKTLLFKTRK